MPYLDTSEAVRTRLHAALAGRSSWVFLTDRAEGAALLGVFTAVALAADVPAAEIDAGQFEFFSIPTGHRALVSFLSLPKQSVSAEDVNALLALYRPEVRTDGDRDLILLPSSDRGREALSAAAAALADGSCFDQPAEAN